MSTVIPSLGFCLTGILPPGERYNKEVHSYGSLIRFRAPNLFDWYYMDKIEQWIIHNHHFIDTHLSNEQIREIDRLLELVKYSGRAAEGVRGNSGERSSWEFKAIPLSVEEEDFPLIRPPTPPPREN